MARKAGAKEPVVRDWTVMARVTRIEAVTVRAASQEEAVAAFERRQWEGDTLLCEIVEWERQGDPKPDD